MKELSVKEIKFCDLYLELGNATQAAIKAGYSERSARQTAADKLKKPKIKAYIAAKMKELESPRIANANEVLAFYSETMRNKDNDMKDRLAAANQLIKRVPTQLEQAKIEQTKATTEFIKVRKQAADPTDFMSGTVVVDDIKKLNEDELRRLANMDIETEDK